MLRMIDFQVIGIANNGEKAIKMYNSFSEKPDIIILDYRMPLKNGLEVAKEILERDRGANIIFASANESVKDIALSIGVKSFKNKPFSIEKLIKNIKKAVLHQTIIPP